MLLAASSGCMGGEEAPATTIPPATKAPHTFSNELLEEQLELFLMGLAYDRDAAQKIARELVSWSDEAGNPLIGTWGAELIDIREKYEEGNTTIEELTDREIWIALELARKIKKEVPVYNVSNWDLDEVIKGEGANCVGYTQLFYVLGNAIGLEIEPIEVVESRDLREGHVASLVKLANNKTSMVELTSNTAFVSQPFTMEEEFIKAGNYLEVKDRDSSKFPHSRIRTIDKDGLMSALFMSRAYNFDALGEYDKALAEYMVAVDLDPKYALAFNNRGATLNRLGYTYDALADLNKAVNLDPRLGDAYSNRGVVHTEIGNYTEAIFDLTRAITLGANTAITYYNRGFAYDRLGNYSRAISDFDKAIELNPEYAKAYYSRAGAFYNLGEHEKSITDYDMALDLDPDLAQAYSNRGIVHASMKEYSLAISDYDKAIELDPRNAVIYYNRGNANYNLGNYSGAVSDYTKAIEIDPYFADAYNNRGNTKTWLGDEEGAQSDFEVAGRLDERFER